MFSELFDDISLMLNVKRICLVLDSLVSAAKECNSFNCKVVVWVDSSANPGFKNPGIFIVYNIIIS